LASAQVTGSSATGSPQKAKPAERAVVLTALLEPALMALRRLAQEHESAQRHSE
jgi:hypothetical protein